MENDITIPDGTEFFIYAHVDAYMLQLSIVCSPCLFAPVCLSVCLPIYSCLCLYSFRCSQLLWHSTIKFILPTLLDSLSHFAHCHSISLSASSWPPFLVLISTSFFFLKKKRKKIYSLFSVMLQ